MPILNHYLLGDEGYLGKDLAAKLKHMGYVLWTPYRKNMQGAKKHNNHQLMAVRRTIESDFTLLCLVITMPKIIALEV